MATITGRSWYDLVSMQASDFQQLMQSQQAIQMGGTAGSVFQQLGGQAGNPCYGYPNSSTTTTASVSGSSTWTFGNYETNPRVSESPAPEIEEPNEPPHKHLQRRVNKWLKGVELPLH